MRGITRVAISLFVAMSFVAPAGSALAAAKTIPLNPAQSVNVKLSDLPRGFVAGVNGIEQHDDDTAAHKKAAFADDKDYYWKNASGDHSTEVSTTVEYYGSPAQAAKFMPADVVTSSLPLAAKAHLTILDCAKSVGSEVCLYSRGVLVSSPVVTIQFRQQRYLVSIMVCNTSKGASIYTEEGYANGLAYTLARKVVTKIKSAKP